MTLYLNFSGDAEGAGRGAMLLGSAAAWEAVRQWAAGLDAAVYPRIRELAATGRTRNTMELGAELELAPEDHPVPILAREAVATLTGAVGVGDEEETVTVGDGDDDAPDADPEAETR